MLSGDGWVVYHGSCLDVLPTLPDDSVDSVVTDPPYELGFMGKSWDSSGIAFNPEVWAECLRVLKPGGHLLAFGGSRTWHRIAVAIEDAGFEVRDSIAWLYGSGFPKSLDISKAIDKAAGAERELRVNERWADRYPNGPGGNLSGDGRSEHYGQAKRIIGNQLMTSDPVTPEAQKWSGWGTALKPAFEPVIVARKPLIGTVAANVLAYGTGGLNIDGSRIAGNMDGVWGTSNKTVNHDGRIFNGSNNPEYRSEKHPAGRWPANVMLDEFTAALVDEQAPSAGGGYGLRGKGGDTYANGKGFANTLSETGQTVGYGDSGGASRFFYVAKASKRDRNEGLDGLESRIVNDATPPGSAGSNSPRAGAGRNGATKNFHPTVKPTDLMRYLVKLVTPPGGTVLDPFTGSGSTGKAAILEGFEFIGCELTDDYLPIIEGRINWAVNKKKSQKNNEANNPTLFDLDEVA